MTTLKRLLLTTSMCCLIATANAAPIDDAHAAYLRGDYSQALKILRPLAAKGNAEAQNNIGSMYSGGEGVTKNDQEALKWFRLAAAQGDVWAQYMTGGMYFSGLGVTQDYKEALKWYKLAAAQGEASAQYNIGVMYAQGRGVTQDYKEAVKWFRLAAAQGNAGAIANLKLPEMVAAAQNSTPDRRSTSIKTGTQQEEQVSSKTNRKTEQPRHTTTRTETPERATVNAAPMDDAIAAHQRGDYAQAIKIWRSLAAQGNADAQTVLGGMYQSGERVPQSYQEAVKWWRLAAAQGNARAQYSLGYMYDKGWGVTQDYKEASKWFRLAADQGHALAQNGIGTLYAIGQGVTQSYQEALKWFRRAAAQGDASAIANLKRPEMVAAAQNSTPDRRTGANAAPMDDVNAAYRRGDYAQALKILRPLAAQGNAEAQNNIGLMYSKGQGVTQSYREALKWYRLAAEQGAATAQYNLGEMYRYGRGVDKDEREAIKWWRLAADQGDASAQNGIGTLYAIGQGVTKNDQEASKWFRLAADQGGASAIANLKHLEMVAAAQNSTPDRRSTSIKTGTQQEEQVSIKTNRKTEQTRRTATRTETPERTSPPKLVFNSSAPKSDGTVELSGRIISDASISEILINGRALEVSLGRDNSFTVTRGLPMGAVTSYRLSVMDEYGQKAETEINVERAAVQYAEQVAPLNPRKLKAQANPNAVALIIGIEAYSRLPQAQYADSDATHFYDYANQSLGVPPHKIKLLTDTKANRVDLLQAMRSWMRTEVNGKSDVYIFFAGHGLSSPDGSKTYLLPADGDRDLLDETSILRDDLIASAKGAKTITMFLDTCYSGGTRTNEVLLADARPIAIVHDKSALPSNVTVLAAASGAQLSSTYEAAQQGLFSYWLMKGLEGDADTNKDKKITTGELHEYVARQVGPMAQRRNRQQDPQLMGDSTRVLVNY